MTGAFVDMTEPWADQMYSMLWGLDSSIYYNI